MNPYLRALRIFSLCAVLLGFAFAETAPTSIRHIRQVSGGEVQIALSADVTPQAQLLAGPDRLVLDFPQTIAASDLKIPAGRGGLVKSIRVGLFTSNPPVTRVVLDLNAPTAFQVYPVAHMVVVRLGSAQRKLAAFNTEFEVVDSPPPVAPPPPPQPILNVQFNNGILRIHAERVSLAQVLNEIQRQTGATITVPPGAQDQVVVNLGPGPVREVVAALLNGTQFNFVMIGSDDDPTQLRSVLLTPKGGGAASTSATPNAQPPNQ